MPIVHRLLLGLLLATSLGSVAHAGKANDTLNVAFENEIETLDNYKATGRTALVVTRELYDGLLFKDEASGTLKPALAKSYKVVDDKTIDFELRPDVKFHDGTTMTADDVVYTLNLVSSKDYNARYQIAVNWIDRAEKTGDYSLRLHLKTPNPVALEMLAGNVPIYPKHYYEKVGPAGMAVKPIGTGPYRLDELTPGTRFVLKRFKDYYKESPRGQPSIGTIIIRVLPEANTRYAELMNGQLDWTWRVPLDDSRNLGAQPNLKIETVEIMRFAYMQMNPNFEGGKSPFANVLVRRAVNHAVNREGILKALVGGASKLINGPCNPMQFGCTTQDVATYKFDPAKAKALLAQAGYPNGFDIELLASAMPHDQTEAIAADLGKAGIRVRVNEQQPGSALSAWRAGKVGMYLSNWGSYGIGDAGLSLGYFFAGTGDDLTNDAETTKAVRAGGSTMDAAKRKAEYAKAVRRVADQAFWVPLWTYSVNCAQVRDLDFRMGADEFVPFERARWK
jgi:peptide/nickel transport system substrate-binding protein